MIKTIYTKKYSSYKKESFLFLLRDYIMTMFGFLGGTIMSVESGYKVFPHPNPDKIYNRLSDAKWFLVVRWCDNLLTPAAIINNTGELAFFNQLVLNIGEEKFIPKQERIDIFGRCLPLLPNETVTYELKNRDKILIIQGLEIDSRYGKVALVIESSRESLKSQ